MNFKQLRENSKVSQINQGELFIFIISAFGTVDIA
jgi:hypothetical protein